MKWYYKNYGLKSSDKSLEHLPKFIIYEITTINEAIQIHKTLKGLKYKNNNFLRIQKYTANQATI